MQSHTIAQLAHVELLSVDPEASVRFFADVLGMTETHRDGRSVYLRGYQDTYHHSLIVTGPSKHGITQSPFLYAFEPGGNRVELFGGYGYMILEPDWETRTWTEANLPTGVSMYGLELPPTYFAHGTPPVEITVDARTDLLKHAPAAMLLS